LQSANLPELKDVAQSRQISTPTDPLSTPWCYRPSYVWYSEVPVVALFTNVPTYSS
jgi:hypothetical protein